MPPPRARGDRGRRRAATAGWIALREPPPARPCLGRRGGAARRLPPRRHRLGRAFRAARGCARGDAPRPRARPPRPRRLAVGAAVADRRPPRGARFDAGRRAGDVARPLVRRAPRARARGPERRHGRAARAARPGARDPTPRRALGRGERAAGPQVRQLLGGRRQALRREPAPRGAEGRSSRPSFAVTSSRTSTGGATATPRPLSSSPTRSSQPPRPAFGDGPRADARRARGGLVPPLRAPRRRASRRAGRPARGDDGARRAHRPLGRIRRDGRRRPPLPGPSRRSARRRARARRRGSRCPPRPPRG